MGKKYKKINYEKIINKRIYAFFVVIIFLFSILFFKLFMVMIVNSKEYDKKLASLTNKNVTLSSAPRGRIYDRNYNIIVDNKAVNTIFYKKSKGTKTKDMVRLA